MQSWIEFVHSSNAGMFVKTRDQQDKHSFTMLSKGTGPRETEQEIEKRNENFQYIYICIYLSVQG